MRTIQSSTVPASAVLLIWALLLLTPSAQAPAPAAAFATIGPAVGERVPDFTLVDQTGTSRTLKSVLGPKGAMLVFFRSADW